MKLLRQIETEIKPEWDKLKVSKKSNGLIEDCEPNMLIGWTDKNLSIWDVSGDSAKPTLENILVALCRTKKQWEKIAYLIFNKLAIEKAKLCIIGTNGNTTDNRIDTSKTHYEIQGITARQLGTLIYYISIDQFETGFFKKTDYDKILLTAYEKIQATQVPTSSTGSVLNSSSSAASTTRDKVELIEENVLISSTQLTIHKAISETK